jgi:hypothetical protein
VVPTGEKSLPLRQSPWQAGNPKPTGKDGRTGRTANQSHAGRRHPFRIPCQPSLLEGHFLLSSGRHSAYYLQCARVLMDPMRASRLASAGCQLPRDLRQQISKVVSPAMGGDHRP